jgi:hypothetical protein
LGCDCLTNLGASKFQSEEGHRVMPAVQMLESGNYIVPYVGTEPYLRGEKSRCENWWLSFRMDSPIFSRGYYGAFIRFSKIPDPVQRDTVCGLAIGSTLLFVTILLIPGTLARYVLLLIAPLSWIIGVACANSAFECSIRFKRFQFRVPKAFVGFSIAIGVVAAMVILPLRPVTYLKRHEVLKSVAARINALEPPDEPAALFALPVLRPCTRDVARKPRRVTGRCALFPGDTSLSEKNQKDSAAG